MTDSNPSESSPPGSSTKPLRFVASTRKDLRSFPEDVRREIGHDLTLVERGGQPRNFKYMKAVGKGVYEIRVRGEDGQYRAFYIARFEEAIYALHVFQKKTQKTPQREIEKSKRRLDRVKRWRQRKGLGG